MATTAYTLRKALLIKKIVDDHYEPGRQDRCRMWVFRNFIIKQYPMSERTFRRMLVIAQEHQDKITKIQQKNAKKMDRRRPGIS